jgi:hypothetical protein
MDAACVEDTGTLSTAKISSKPVNQTFENRYLPFISCSRDVPGPAFLSRAGTTSSGTPKNW